MSIGATGATLGASYGGLLGQLGSTFSAPRRALWRMVGLPESGAELLGGSDPSPLASFLGTTLEVATDPLTLGFGLLGSPVAKLLQSMAHREHQLGMAAKAIPEIVSDIRSGRDAWLNTARQQLQNRAAKLEELDLAGIGLGHKMRHAANSRTGLWATDPSTAAAVSSATDPITGQPLLGPLLVETHNNVPVMTVLGRELPPGTQIGPARNPQDLRKLHGRGPVISDMNEYVERGLTASDLNFLRQISGGDALGTTAAEVQQNLSQIAAPLTNLSTGARPVQWSAPPAVNVNYANPFTRAAFNPEQEQLINVFLKTIENTPVNPAADPAAVRRMMAGFLAMNQLGDRFRANPFLLPPPVISKSHAVGNLLEELGIANAVGSLPFQAAGSVPQLLGEMNALSPVVQRQLNRYTLQGSDLAKILAALGLGSYAGGLIGINE